MRVLALASCGGLLALASCSAKQSSLPNQGGVLPEGDDAPQVKPQPGLRVNPSSPLARPEILTRQTWQRPAVKSAPQTKEAQDQIQAQALQIRARLQRLRDQRGAQLGSNIPVVAAPVPAIQSLNLPKPQPAALNTGNPTETPTLNPLPSTVDRAVNGATDHTPAIVADPEPQAANIAPSATATDLPPLAAASLAQSYPIAPLRHQGYSSRSRQPAPVLTGATPAPGEGSSVAVTASRLHGETPGIQSPPGALTASPEAIAAPPETTLTAAAVPPEVAAAVPSAGELNSEPGVTHHAGSSISVPINISAEAAAESAPREISGGHYGQAVTLNPEPPLENLPPVSRGTTGAETAIALPESLPLGSPSPRLSRTAPRPAPLAPERSLNAEVASSRVLVADPPWLSELQRVASPMGAPIVADKLASSATPPVLHSGEALTKPVHLASSSADESQSLAASCQVTRDISPTPEIDSSGTAPQFSRVTVADLGLAPKAGLKQDPSTLDPCIRNRLQAVNPAPEAARPNETSGERPLHPLMP